MRITCISKTACNIHLLCYRMKCSSQVGLEEHPSMNPWEEMRLPQLRLLPHSYDREKVRCSSVFVTLQTPCHCSCVLRLLLVMSHIHISANSCKKEMFCLIPNNCISNDVLNNLKLSGEVHHLHSEVTRYEAQRESLAQELVSMTRQIETLQTKVQDFERLKAQYTDMEQKYNALLQVGPQEVEKK